MARAHSRKRAHLLEVFARLGEGRTKDVSYHLGRGRVCVREAHPRQRGASVGAWTRGGRTKERGHTCSRTSPNITRLLQGRRIYKWAKAKASSKARGKFKGQGKA
jgi:hypothetical protein